MGDKSLRGKALKRGFLTRRVGLSVEIEKEASEECAAYASKRPCSTFLLVDFCFGGLVTRAEILASSGVGSRLISSSGFFGGFIVLFKKSNS